VKYALWLYNNGTTFADMPEVRQVLDEHLTTDPSIAIHSVYGRFFPWLVVLDKAWGNENRTTIFDGAAGSVAWEAYVTFSPAYDEVAGLLAPYYDRAIVALDPARQPPARTSKPDPDEHLGEHLMAQYWRNKLALQQSIAKPVLRTRAHPRTSARYGVRRTKPLGAQGQHQRKPARPPRQPLGIPAR
jgi:hypothetical protein